MMTTGNYRFVGGHPDTLDDGRPVSAGSTVTLTGMEVLKPSAARMIADGVLVKFPAPKVDGVSKPKTAKKTTPAKAQTGRNN
jgi:hypothetical protein